MIALKYQNSSDCCLVLFLHLHFVDSLLSYIALFESSSPSLVDHLNPYLSTCLISHLPQLSVSCISQGNTFQQEWQRVEFGSGFSISGPDPRVLARSSKPTRLLTRFFSQGPDPPPSSPAGPVKPCQIWAQSTAQIVAQPKKKKRIEWPLPISLRLFFFLVHKI